MNGFCRNKNWDWYVIWELFCFVLFFEKSHFSVGAEQYTMPSVMNERVFFYTYIPSGTVGFLCSGSKQISLKRWHLIVILICISLYVTMMPGWPLARQPPYPLYCVPGSGVTYIFVDATFPKILVIVTLESWTIFQSFSMEQWWKQFLSLQLTRVDMGET